MKFNSLFLLTTISILSFTGEVDANSNTLMNGVRIKLYGEPYKIPDGSQVGHRSISPLIPISAFLINNSVELEFCEDVGEVEIIISHEEEVVYSSSEIIDCYVLQHIQLSHEYSDNFLLEIKGNNGFYVYGHLFLETSNSHFVF